MSKEKVILSSLAVMVGLSFAALGFYFYQGARFEEQSNGIIVNAPSPTPKPNIYLEISEPQDESVSDTKLITVSGKTKAGSIVVILTEDEEQVVNPTELGDFTASITLADGENLIQITAIAENGESVSIDRIVTYSTESF